MNLKNLLQKYLPFMILLSVIFGILAGFIFEESIGSAAWMGVIFMNALKMVIVPLIVSSLIMGMYRLGDVRKMGKTGVRTIFFYMTTMAIAVSIGLVLSNIIQPGEGIAETPSMSERKLPEGGYSFLNVILGIVPSNIFSAFTEGRILSIIFFSILFGGVLTTIGEKGKVLVDFFSGVEEVMIKIVFLILFVSPLGIFGLVAGQIANSGGVDNFLQDLWMIRFYVLNVVIGLLIHSLIVLPLLIRIFARRNPFTYLADLFPAVAVAFSTASSSATLPVTMDCATRSGKISRKTSGFVLPLGATINMDGTALYEAAAAMFIAQMAGIELDLTQQFIVFLTATLAAIGAAGIPEAGLVTMLLVLQAVNLPSEGIVFLLTVDWFLDRCRTAVNVWGDASVAAVIDHSMGSVKS
ncbi:MAG: dicarboxylate/amino acid:cation symporter [Spirochaetia bacterium]|nr:dicarboxylate/amino acid:cation symporter [Spirochaetia bacterium]